MKVSQNIDALDIAKVVFALMVVAIHAPLSITIAGSENLLMPWLNLAVPMFFLISFYLLSVRLRLEGSDEGRAHIRLRYLWRNILLYGIWFIILLPVTIMIRRECWFGHGIARGIATFLRSLFFGSTFQGSYFLSASVIAVCVVSFLQGKIRAFGLLLLSLMLYGFVMLSIDGYFLTHTTGLLPRIYFWTKKVVGDPYYNFLRAIPYVVVAKYISIPKLMLQRDPCISSKHRSCCGFLRFVVVALLMTAYYLEWFYFGHIGMTLAFVCVALLIWIKDLAVELRFAKYLRKFSIVLYLSHLPLIYIMNWFINRGYFKIDAYGFTKFFSAVVFGVILTFLIHKLEKHPNLRWLRFMH